MRTRIGTRLMLGAGLVTSLVIGVMAVLVMRSHTTQLVYELNQSANQVSATIKSATHDDMLENRREDLHRQIRSIGGLQADGIQKVRLFNNEGRIMFSSDREEIGTALDKRGEACYACHVEGRPLEKLDITSRSRIFRAPDGSRILGIINPIPNEPSCWTADCHAHSQEQKVLGVLDVNLSMVQADRQIRASREVLLGLAALAIAASSLIIWWLNKRLVLRPVAALLEGTRRVAAGDLSTNIPATANHELGDLAKAFNAMTQRISETQRQLTQADKLASVGRLAAGVAHEINNPLTGVLTYASLLAKRYAGDDQTREDLEVIVRETKRCRGIIRELLDFARPTAPARKPTDLNEVVRRSLAVVMNQLSMNHVDLTLDLSEHLPDAFAEGNQIQQVVVNLLLNAADAIGPDGGRIRIVTETAQLLPWGNAVIRRAACPKGHDLMDPGVRIGGLPSVRVLAALGGLGAMDGVVLPLNLDPVYGRFQDLGREGREDGTRADYACPVCRRSLQEPERLCEVCGAPTLTILAGADDPVYRCTRKGCHTAHWPSRDQAGARDMVELRVEDSGSGITPEDLPHIFEPFFSNKGNRGTGLGLAVSWGIIEGHSGTIEVQSEPGRGTQFTVRLPLAPRASQGAGPVPPIQTP
jgi:two-component system NtrC family sensor kinase